MKFAVALLAGLAHSQQVCEEKKDCGVERTSLLQQSNRDQVQEQFAEFPGDELTGLKTSQKQASDSKYWKDVHVYVGPERVLGKKGQLHGQVGQDWLVASMMGCKREGFFLDLAANEPESLSNTLMLERDFGWNGICVEANKKWLYGLAGRKCKQVMGVAGSPSNQEVKFALQEGKDGLAGIVGPTTDNKDSAGQKVDLLRTVRIEDFLGRLDAPLQIDYFSLDVEGAESIVMHGFDWNKYRFSIITVERPKDDLVTDLKNNGYKMLRTNADFGDYTWVDSRLSGHEDWAATWQNHAAGLPAAGLSCLDARGYQRPTSLKP